MKTGNHKTKELSASSSFLLRGGCLCARGPGIVCHASLLTGMALIVVLGLMFTLSTPSFAMGGGGGGGSSPAPKVTKVVESVAEPKDETAEVKNPVVEPKGEAPAVGGLDTKKPEEKVLAIEEPTEDKIKTKPDEGTTEFPNPDVNVTVATVGFAVSSPVEMHENRGHLQLEVRISEPFPQSVTLNFVAGGTAVQGADYEISSTSLTIPVNSTSASLTLTSIDDDVAEVDEKITLTLAGGLLPAGVAIGARGTHTVTIPANDQVADIDKKTREEAQEVTVKPEGNTGDETLTDTENKTVNGHDKGAIDFPGSEDEVVEATVGFAYTRLGALIKNPRGSRYRSVLRREFGWSDDNNSMPVVVTLSNPLPQPLELSLNTGEADALLQDGEGTIDIYYPGRITFAPGETRKVLWFDLDVVDGAWDEPIEPVKFTLYGDLPDGVKFGARSFVLRFDLVPAPNVEEDGIDGTTEVEDIDVGHYDEGKISIVNEGHVNGIRALHYDADNKNTEISIENLGVVDNNVVARVFNVQNGGGISIKNAIQGTVGGEVIGKHHGDGDISIENHGTINRSIRAVQFRGGGDISIENHGNVAHGVTSKHHGDGDISIENHGTIGGISVLHLGSSGDISIENHGTVRTVVNHYGAGDVLVKNYGIDEGTIVRHHGDSGIIHFDGNLFEGGFVGKTIRFGNVNFGNADFKNHYYDYYGEDVTDFEGLVRGSYEASNDTQLNFWINPDWDYQKWYGSIVPRRFRIDGDITGQSRVSLVVDDVSSITESTNFPALIVVEGDHDVEADSFVGEQTIGAFNYVLEYDTFEEFLKKAFIQKGDLAGRYDYHIWGLEEWYDYHTWGFVNRGLSDVAVKSSQIPDGIAKNMETPPTTNPNKKTKKLGLWGDLHGSHATIGLDALAVRWMGGNMLVGTSVTRNSSTSNSIDVESQIAALTASWERKGFYVDGQTRYAGFTSDVSTNRLSVVRDNEGSGVNASVDLGYRLALPFGGMDFKVAPQMQLVWSRVNFDDFAGPHGEKISLEDGDLVTGRFGLSWDGGWQDAGGFGQVYGGMNLRSAVDGRTSVNVSGVSITNNRDDLSIDGKLGLSYEWNEGYAFNGEVSVLRDEDTDEIRADLRVQIDF